MDEVESAKAELKTELEAVKQQLTEAAGNRAGIEAARDEAASKADQLEAELEQLQQQLTDREKEAAQVQ